MIYFKVNKNVYNELSIDKGIKDYPLLRIKTLYRIIKKQLNNNLKDYPDIDIVLNYKYTNKVLGRFYKNRLFKGIEYKFLGNKINPCIVLFWVHIDNYYLRHNVKGLLKVLYHEYGHFKQWLLNNRLNHNRLLEAQADNKNIDNQLNLCKYYLDLQRG